MKKSVLILVPILLVILLVAGVGIGIYISNNQPDSPKNEETNQVDGEEAEPQELTVEFFGDFKPFECSGDYISFSYISDVMNKDGTRFFSRSHSKENEHRNMLVYTLPSGEEKIMFSISDPDVDVDVVSFIDDALYFNISNSGDMGIDGLYRMWLDYNEAGDIIDSDITLRFNLNLEPVRARNNTLLLRYGEQYYTFDTQTGEYSEYNTPSYDFENLESEEAYMLALPKEFVPFKCSGDYYSFDGPKNQYGFEFVNQYVKDYSLDYGGTYKIVYNHNNEETVLFDTEKLDNGVSVSAPAYIDNNLFLCVYQKNVDTLYRIAFEYDSDGNIVSSDLYFVAENVNWPVKAMKNVLIIEKAYGEYVSLNTKTGEISPVEYNNEVDPSSVKVSVSFDKAIEIAEKELEKDKYRVFNGVIEEKYIPNVDGFGPVLIHDPDLMFHGGYRTQRFEDYPEYVWVLRYDTEYLYQQVSIYVNAASGNISYVQVQPYP